MNDGDAATHELIDAVALALHWQPHKGITEAVAARMTAESEDQPTATALAPTAYSRISAQPTIQARISPTTA